MNTASPFIIERFKKAKQLEDKKGKQIKESKFLIIIIKNYLSIKVL